MIANHEINAISSLKPFHLIHNLRLIGILRVVVNVISTNKNDIGLKRIKLINNPAHMLKTSPFAYVQVCNEGYAYKYFLLWGLFLRIINYTDMMTWVMSEGNYSEKAK